MTAVDREFKRITGFRLFERQANYYFGGVEREDRLFTQLASLYFSKPQSFKKLKKRIQVWIQDERETTLALAGYIYYISEDFIKAKEHFIKTIHINPDNLDNWIDLSFSLRHLGEYKLSNAIMFNHHYIIHYYKYLKLYACSYVKLKRLLLEIERKAPRAKAGHQWRGS
ncbi:MAG: hypothetical protein QME65_05085 [Candidatus Omnitrophota bacterium]|nr:hypothetical protein [Candidatus Omnitrophota bacterium]